MDISIIIINYNTFDLTSNCIRSIIQYTTGVSYQVIVVDNASTECSPERFLEEFPELVLIRSAVNGGFAYGNNLGLKKATGEFILLLNSDTILNEDSISKSIRYLREHAEAGAVGCRMVYPDGSVQHTARRFRSIKWEFLDLFRFVPLLMPYKKRSRLMLGKYFKNDENIECDWINGAFFLIPRMIIEKFPDNKLDDHFFMYGEDQLWCEQIKRLGFKILFFAGTTIIHISRGSSDVKKQSALRMVMLKHELEIMRLRKGKSLYYYVFALIYVLKDIIRNSVKMIIYTFSGRSIR